MLASKPDDLSLIPRAQEKVEGGTDKVAPSTPCMPHNKIWFKKPEDQKLSKIKRRLGTHKSRMKVDLNL